MSEGWEDRYREDIRRFLEEKCLIMQPFEERRTDWEREHYDVDGQVSPYGWTDYLAVDHARKCSLIIPKGAQVWERTYSMFAGTFVDNENEVGLNVYPVGCKCGEISERYGRWVGSLQDLLRHLLGYRATPRITL